MANVSLEKSLNVNKVAWYNADNISSDRYESPQNMLCSPWKGYDSYGRQADENTFVTETAGCNRPTYRMEIENLQRPRYFEYVGYSAKGLEGNSTPRVRSIENPKLNTPNYFSVSNDNPFLDDKIRQSQMAKTGLGYSSIRQSGTVPGINAYRYNRGVEGRRTAQIVDSRDHASDMRSRSGF